MGQRGWVFLAHQCVNSTNVKRSEMFDTLETPTSNFRQKIKWREHSSDVDFILKKLSTDITNAKQLFKEFNDRKNNDQYLEDTVGEKRLSDDEARLEIKELLGSIEIAQVKSLPRKKRNEVLRKVRGTNGLSLRQAARILGVSHNLIFKA